MNFDLPINPGEVKVPAPVDIVPSQTAVVLSDTEVEAITQELATIEIPERLMNDLASMGIGIDQRGAVKIANGCNMVAAKTVMHAINQIHAGITSPKTAKEFAAPLKDLVNALAKVTKPIADSAPPPVPIAMESGQKKGLRPFGAGVPVNVQINHNYVAQQSVAKEDTKA